mmetsp:Transcript_35765/g.56986  ORF Transcript_35765/g.56986 Transcript_35765/m.56986 type:complete len:267 (+) Transcript_35765:60-860(+)
MGAGASSKKYTGTVAESDANARSYVPTPQLKPSLTIKDVASGRGGPKVCERCCVKLMELHGRGGAISYQCPQCGSSPGQSICTSIVDQLKMPDPTSASEYDVLDRYSSASKSSTTRRPSKETSTSNERFPSKQRRPSKEKTMSRTSSKVSTEAPQDSPISFPADRRVVRHRSTQTRSISLPGINDDVGFAPGDKVVFVQYDAIAESSFGFGLVVALGEKPGLVRVKFEKQDQAHDFKADTLKKLSQVEERSITHGSRLARRNTVCG